MNGAQDMGGQMGFGPIEEESDEPAFHADWERRVFGLSLAMTPAAGWNIDMGRHARESLPPADYLSSSYFEIWLKGLERLLCQTEFVTADELAAGHSLVPGKPVRRAITADDVRRRPNIGSPSSRSVETTARFDVGDHVRTRNIHPAGHTRLPRYARAKRGVVARVHGAHVFPDSHAHGRGEAPQWLYTVEFTGPELWGDDADPTSTISVEAWESYLEPG